METQEPIYVGPILPASFDAEQFQDDIEVPVNTNNPPQENIVVNTMDQPMSNFLFNIITLINTLLHFSMIIFLRISLKPGGNVLQCSIANGTNVNDKTCNSSKIDGPIAPNS